MAKKSSHTVYRGPDGQLIKKSEADRLPKDKVTKEQMPNPGHGDTGRGGKKGK
jgi:hypothetical protein